jgi:hypothetical protein
MNDSIWVRRHNTFDEVVDSCDRGGILATWSDRQFHESDIEYIRADLHDKLVTMYETLEWQIENGKVTRNDASRGTTRSVEALEKLRELLDIIIKGE